MQFIVIVIACFVILGVLVANAVVIDHERRLGVISNNLGWAMVAFNIISMLPVAGLLIFVTVKKL